VRRREFINMCTLLLGASWLAIRPSSIAPVVTTFLESVVTKVDSSPAFATTAAVSSVTELENFKF
jgi:hypothetical protein